MGVACINDLLCLNGYMSGHDFYRVDYFVHVLFSVILVEFYY